MTSRCTITLAGLFLAGSVHAAFSAALQMPALSSPDSSLDSSIFVLNPPVGPPSAQKLDAQNLPVIKRAQALAARASNGNILSQSNAYLAAIALDSALIAHTPADRTAYYQDANFQIAIALLDIQAMNKQGADTATLTADCRLHLEKAAALDEAAAALDPKSTVAYAQESDCHDELGLIYRAAMNAATSKASYMDAGKAMETEFSLAIGLENRVIKLNPHDTNAYYQKASIQSGDGDDDDAIATDQADLKQNPRDISIYYQETDVYFDMGEYRSSIAVDKQIVSIDPTETEAYANGAWLMESDRDYSDAVAFYHEGIKNNPKVSLLPYQLGSYYFNTAHDYQQAIAAFKQSIACPDADWNSWKMLAHSQEKAGKWLDAECTWTATLEKFGSIPLYKPVLENNLTRVHRYITDHHIGAGIAV